MKLVIPAVVGLFGIIAMPGIAADGDAEGCADLKIVPRVAGCLIQECSAKQHESFDASVENGAPLDANLNTLTYSCPASKDFESVKRELDAAIHKAGYLNVAEDKVENVSTVVTARKSSRWIRWSVNSEDGISYSLTAASPATEKLKAEACTAPAVLSLAKTCEMVDCASKAEDSTEVRTSVKDQTSVAGNVQTVMLSCPAAPPIQAFPAAEDELKRSGFEILFIAHERPESGWLTGRQGKQWIELVSGTEGDAASYTLTSISSGEVLSASSPDPEPNPPAAIQVVAATESVQQPTPTPAAAVIRMPEPVSAPAPPLPEDPAPEIPASGTTAVVPSTPAAPITPPRPVVKAQIAGSHDLMWSISGMLVIHMLVDVNEEGLITNAVLTGRINKDVLLVESAAREALKQWRFEPARQNGRAVAATKVPVQLRFQGRPWQY
jgi:hypothetical protein